MKIEETQRGFQIINFTDKYGKECSLQQSSLAEYDIPGTSAIWFGRDKNRMHIDRKQLKKLMKHLKKWIKKGKF